MTELDAEVKKEILACIERSDIQQIHDILDALESAENPNVVKVEFTHTQMKDLELVRQNIKQPSIASVLRMMVDGFMPGYKESLRKQRKIQA